jgi:hypothetical protein
MKSTGTTRFWQLYRRLPPEVQIAARRTYQKFRKNPAHPSLQLERLRSDPRGWSVRVTRNHRAVALRLPGDVWIWDWIGDHAEFDREYPS